MCQTTFERRERLYFFKYKTYTLVDDDTNGTAGDVENAASGTVVDFVWHTLLNGTITFDIDNITLEPNMTFELNVKEWPRG